MTSNSLPLPSGDDLKLLWKDTILKSLFAKAYFLVLIYLVVTEVLYEGFCTLFELTDQAVCPLCVIPRSSQYEEEVIFLFDFSEIKCINSHFDIFISQR